ncbi:hypothetical protein SEEGA711_26580 [Salmonella enterica subsp. enterica serovar Gaminara str. ATCC BAA-711]|nr:hypothetical protein SEEGA711_26580 [Salmonella enterica subsp. enterica serovar Gaminara str. ATCC BAA-711]
MNYIHWMRWMRFWQYSQHYLQKFTAPICIREGMFGLGDKISLGIIVSYKACPENTNRIFFLGNM